MTVLFYTLASTRDVTNIKYVGKTIKNLSSRLSQHLYEAKRKLKDGYTHNHKCNWINKELKEGYQIVIELLDCVDCLNNKEWAIYETMWISLFKSWGFQLVNITDGGEGVSGSKQTRESNEKRSKALLNTHRSEETKLKISKSSKGKIITEQTKNKISKTIIELQGRKISQYDSKTGEFIKTWDSIKDAAEFYNTDSTNILKCCQKNNNRITAVGYIWKYKEDISEILINKDKYIYCIYPTYVIECVNQTDAINKTNISKNSIIDCLKKRKQSCKGVIFLSREDYLQSTYLNLKLVN